MKPLQILACSIAFLIPAAVNAASADLPQLLTAGQTAYMKGDLATAKSDLEWALRLDPHNKVAIGYLRMISVQEAQQNKGLALEKQLDLLMIPKLDFKEATLGSALDYMKKAADRLSNGKTKVSFVVQVPAEQVNSQPVTLSLQNIPFTEALRYIGGLTGLSFSYEKYAIVVRSTAGAAPSASSNPSGALPAAK